MKKVRLKPGHREVGYWQNGIARVYNRVQNRSALQHQGAVGRYSSAPPLMDGKIEVHGLIRRAGLGRNDNNFEIDLVFHKKETKYKIVQTQFDKKKNRAKRMIKYCPAALDWYKSHDFILVSDFYTLTEFYNKNCN